MPNLTIGPMVCKSLIDYGIKAPIDVHLMVKPVERLIDDFAEAGASVISFHPEATENMRETISLIKSLDKKVGVSLNPDTNIKTISDHLDNIDLVLIMSVFPGFGGQKFIPEVLNKIKSIKEIKAVSYTHLTLTTKA